jgi:hypothetical protein
MSRANCHFGKIFLQISEVLISKRCLQHDMLDRPARTKVLPLNNPRAFLIRVESNLYLLQDFQLKPKRL